MFIQKLGKRVVYLDHIATTPVAQEVIDAMLPYFREHFGNPTSLHSFGQVAKKAINNAREKIAQLINANSPEEVVFTSGGIEANNLAIKGIAKAYEKKGRHIVSTDIEHHSILHPLKTLEREGWEVAYLKPDRYGLIHPDQVREAVRNDTVLVSIGHSNREIGTIQNTKELVKAAKEKNPKVVFHTDACPTLGHYPVDLQDWGVDAASFTAHLMYGPKGVGALWTRKGVKIRPLIEGGTQERGVRAGTENVPGIVGFGAAAELAMKELEDRECLKHAFAGESQANRRYLYFARKADIEGYPDIANIFRETAEGETGHAFGHIEFLEKYGGGDPATGMPIGTMEQNLEAAIAGETYEYTEMYPGFAKIAREEGFDDIAEWFETLARAEKSHAGRFQKALESLKA
jgi:cysteine sulfinate desulfinase/cysteine desulfurase-like protein